VERSNVTLDSVRVSVGLKTADGQELHLRTRRFELTECIGQCFVATTTLLSTDLDLEVDSLLWARAQVEIDRPGFTARTLRAVVTSAGFVAVRSHQLFVRVVLEPSLALLRLSTRTRIFTDRTLPQVLEEIAGPVFEEFGGAWNLSRLRDEQPARDYQVQYGERDLDFVLRLLSESGLCLLHGDADDERQTHYVLTDHNAALPAVGLDAAAPTESAPVLVPFHPEGEAEEQADEPGVQALVRADNIQPGGVTVRARDWKHLEPGMLETRREHGRLGHQWQHHPRRIDEGKGSGGPHLDDTDAWAARAFEDVAGRSVVASGRSIIADLTAGSTFELQGHPQVDLDGRYAVTQVVHEADFPEVDLHGGPQAAPTYANRFVVQPLELGPVRPAVVPRPRVSGIESAVVVGPQGEEVHTDALGRVQVRFHWDDAPGQTCWLRVMTPWAGPGYGASFVPRVGMEVVVGFLGGNPDRPVVTGCLWTGGNPPPGALPQTKTCTTLRTQSSPGGEGYNELRFEDAAGSEEVFLHAQRNQRTVVRAAQSTQVGASRSLSVGNDSARNIDGSETVQIGKPNAEAKGELQVFVTGGEFRDVGDVHSLHASSAFWTADEGIVGNAEQMVRWSCATAAADSAGRSSMGLHRPPTQGSVLEMKPTSVTLEAPESIELKVGKTVLRLTPQGIAMEGTVITASADRRLWLSADAGSLSLDTKRAELFGGHKSESVLRLQAWGAECKAQGNLVQSGSSVNISGSASAKLESPATHVFGADTATLKGASVGVTGASVEVHSEGLVDVRGQPIHLNC